MRELLPILCCAAVLACSGDLEPRATPQVPAATATTPTPARPAGLDTDGAVLTEALVSDSLGDEPAPGPALPASVVESLTAGGTGLALAPPEDLLIALDPLSGNEVPGLLGGTSVVDDPPLPDVQAITQKELVAEAAPEEVVPASPAASLR